MLPFGIKNAFMAGCNEDKSAHVDVWVCTDDMMLVRFDAKDVKTENISSGKYTLSKTCIEEDYKNVSLYFAFRLNDRKSVRYKSFCVVERNDLINNCTFKDCGTYYLVSIDEIRSKCKTWEIEDDT